MGFSKFSRWGYIYTLGAGAEANRVEVVGSPACMLVTVGVPTVADAPQAARALVADGVERIELGGAFGPEGMAAVVAAVGDHVAIGH